MRVKKRSSLMVAKTKMTVIELSQKHHPRTII
jgi:hypothetical protein